MTHQTGPLGKLVSRLYVEETVDIRQDIYLAFVLDRKAERVMIVASASGRMEIEEIAEQQPNSIIRATVDPGAGMQQYQAREIAFGLGLENNLIGKATETLLACYRVFRDYDASMLEINPLVVTRDGNLMALDAKVSFDENALFRRPEISELRDKSQEDPRETFASDRGLSYVGLDGNIGWHHQWRRPRHGDDGYGQDRRRRAGKLPRHRRLRNRSAPYLVTRMSRPSSSTSSPASFAVTGSPRAL